MMSTTDRALACRSHLGTIPIHYHFLCSIRLQDYLDYRTARIRDVVENPLNLLKATWTPKVSRYGRTLQEAGTGFNLLPVPLSTLGGWHPDAHKALCSVASTIAARGLSTFSSARSILFQRHAALLVTNNALCLMLGLLSDI